METTPMITCLTCVAACCQQQVLLISDTGIPQRFISTDRWGGQVMRRLEDGWCAALDRNTMRCSIYERRPQICRDFEMSGRECLAARVDLMGPEA